VVDAALARELGDVLSVPQPLYEHVVGLEVAVRQAVLRQVAVAVEVLQPPRGLPEQLELGAALAHRAGADQERERAARRDAAAGLNAGLHGEVVDGGHLVAFLLGAVDPHHVHVLRVTVERAESEEQSGETLAGCDRA